jgi:predicted TIM-barrel fold metal-dependent hydrolase
LPGARAADRALIKDLDISEADRAAIFFANAARLLKLPSARAAHAA